MMMMKISSNIVTVRIGTEKPTKPAEEHEVWEPRILLRWRRLARQVLKHDPMETEAWHDVAPLEAESDRHNRG